MYNIYLNGVNELLLNYLLLAFSVHKEYLSSDCVQNSRCLKIIYNLRQYKKSLMMFLDIGFF